MCITMAPCVGLHCAQNNRLNPFNEHVCSIRTDTFCEGLRSAGLRHYFWIERAGIVVQCCFSLVFCVQELISHSVQLQLLTEAIMFQF